MADGTLRAKLTFPTKCRECGVALDDNEARVGIVRAGSAWKSGFAILEEGAHLLSTATYHLDCAPEDVP